MKWLLRAACLLLVCALVPLNYRAIQAERHYSQGQLWARSGDALQSFAAMKVAYETMPFDSRIRMQYFLSLESLRSRDKTNIDKSASDIIYGIGKSASPLHQAIMASRATYLLNSGRWQEDDEIKGLIIALRNKAKVYPETWLISAYYNARVGNQAGAADSLIKGLKAGGRIETFRKVARQINLEIEEK